jgi:hypothetical protein
MSSSFGCDKASLFWLAGKEMPLSLFSMVLYHSHSSTYLFAHFHRHENTARLRKNAEDGRNDGSMNPEEEPRGQRIRG